MQIQPGDRPGIWIQNNAAIVHGTGLFFTKTHRKLGGVNRLSKGILGGIVLIAGGLLLVAFLLQTTLRSEATRKALQESLSQALRMDVRFESLRPTVFKGSLLTGLKASRDGGSSLCAKEVYVRPRLLSLLRGQCVLSEIRIAGARLILVEHPKTPAQSEADDKTQTALVHRGRPRLAIRRFKIENSAFECFDASGKARAQLEGIHLELVNIGPESGEGTLRIAQGKLYELLPFQHLDSPVQITASHCRLPALRATCGAGVVEATASIETSAPQLPFQLRADARDIDLSTFSEPNAPRHATGKAAGRVELSGLLLQPDSLQGSGQLSLENGTLKGFGTLQAIGEVFHISELARLRVQEARSRFTIAHRKISLQELVLQGNDLTLSAPGDIGFDHQLQLQAQISLPERLLSGKVLQMFRDRFSPPDAAGLRSIAFSVTGTTDRPKTNLLESLVGGSLGGVLDQLMGTFLKPKKSDKPAAPPAGSNP
ncbi:MAG: AsmA-like C-terminal region [Verrucomicrobiota bacterium]|jgi:hypothetical protein